AQADLLLRPAAGPGVAAGSLPIDRLLAAVDGDASVTVQDSQLAGVPMSGEVRLHSVGATVQVDGQLTLAGNRLTLQGRGGGAPAADQWHAVLKAADLARLAPLGRLLDELAPGTAAVWPRAGSLDAEVQTHGRWPLMRSDGALQAQALALGGLAVRSASLDWRHGQQVDDALRVQLKAESLRSGTQQIDQLTATIDGTLRAHAIRLLLDSPARPPAWAENLLGPAGTGTRLEAEARGQWQGAIAGAGTASRYSVQGMKLQGGARDAQGGSRPWLAAQGLTGELLVGSTGALQSLQLAPGRVQLPSTALNWRELRWQAAVDGPPGTRPGPGRLDVAAELETIDLARLLARLQPEMGWGGDLTLGGRIEIHSAGRLDADIVLERGAGDLSVTDDLGQTRALGLTDLRLALSAHDGLWQLAQGLAGRRVGSMAGAQVLRTTPERHWPPGNAPLQGVLEARVAELGVWGTWIPPGWRLSGALDTIAQFSGTLAAPQVNGSMRGRGLGVRNVLQGVSLTEGELSLVLEGDNARIGRFDFKGGDGQLTLTGGATLGAQPRATLRLVADHFRVLGRLDRRLVATGQANLALDAERLRLDGAFKVDEGLFDIGRGDAPTLDADVTVTRSAIAASANGSGRGTDSARPATPTPPVLRQAQVDLKIGLGEQLRLRGRGVDTGLRGDLQLSTPGGKLAIIGTVRTQDGRYAAYGQKMEITRGRFIFSGEPDNPRLDVLAIRPNLDVTVGVLVDGMAHNPRVRLYSEPEMAEYDKLSWLVMGRSPDGLGTADTALLQRAAFALLAGDTPGPTDQLLEAIGLTDFSLRQTEGTTRDTIVTLGKQLSRRWYVGYERSVHATTGTWQLIYRIAQRFTLRAQSGAENAVDLIWSWRW
ncbi:MAG: translocation/assembly module TamB domain-containing protein, partial [Aquabacterium sp.]|nr:translocation/assembly module TamB domain-containing protein [Aquabacterium sp.]